MSLKQQMSAAWRHIAVSSPQQRKHRRHELNRNAGYESLESLEQRCLLTASALTASDQLMLELMNRARANPGAEAARQGVALNQGVAAGETISTAAKQPLAPNNLLDNAANGHTADMFARGFFRHLSPAPGSTDFDDRVTNAGYTFTTVGENLALQQYATLNQTTVVTQMHNGLYVSPGHRVNMMNDGFLEAGLGISFGSYTDNDNAFQQGAGTVSNAGATTISFGTRAQKPFITGVVYTDASNGSATDDAFYSIGEAAGNGGTITATDTSTGAAFSETIGVAGGYALQVPAGTYNVTVTGGGLSNTFGQNNVVVGTSNVKVDFETTTATVATITLAAPVITTANNKKTADQQFTLNWNTVSGANRYEVTYTRVANNQVNYVNGFVTTNSFTPSTALPIGKYNIWVRVNGTDGAMSPWSTPISVQVNTSTTIDSLTANQTTQRPAISWSAVTGAARYEVWGTNVTTQVSRAFSDTGITTTSYTPSANLDMGVYRVWVRAFDAADLAASWSTSEVFNIGPQPTSPVVPTFDTTPQFSWTAVSGTSTYQLYVQRGSTVVINESGITAATFTPTSALTSGDYRWWVRPFTAAGRGGAWTNYGEFNIDGRPVVLSPSGTVTDGAPAISWTPVTDAVTYEVYLFNDDTGALVTRQNGLTATSFVSPALVNGNYRVWVRAFQSGGTSGTWSRVSSFTVNAATVTLPVTLVSPLTPTLDTTPEFQWNAVSGAGSYDIYLHNGTTAVTETGITGTTFTPATPLADGQWQWWVRGVNSVGAAGAWSSPGSTDVSGRPVLSGPTGATADTTPTFSWSAVSGAIKYSLQVNDITTGTAVVVIRDDNVTSNNYTPVIALNAGTYRFWVQAVEGTNRSPWSFSVDFTIAQNETQVDDASELLLTQLSPLAETERDDDRKTDSTVEWAPNRSVVVSNRRKDVNATSDIDAVMQQFASDGVTGS